jgi:hypothetical protein
MLPHIGHGVLIKTKAMQFTLPLLLIMLSPSQS